MTLMFPAGMYNKAGEQRAINYEKMLICKFIVNQCSKLFYICLIFFQSQRKCQISELEF